jgi:DNA-binding transcriptional LysR family regulator
LAVKPGLFQRIHPSRAAGFWAPRVVTSVHGDRCGQDEKIIAFNRQNLSFTERYFNEKFEAYDVTKNIAYTCDDTYSLVSLVAAGLGIGFAPEWTLELANRAFELKKVKGIDFRIGLGVAWNKEDPTAARDDIVDIARSLARAERSAFNKVE